jgi:hypothetical protein
VEALIAAGLLGITIVTGVTAWDSAIIGAQQATRKAWARCVGRSEIEAILAAPWPSDLDDPGSPYQVPSSVPKGTVRVSVTSNSADTLETVGVAVSDPQSGTNLYSASALKARVLAGTRQVNGQAVTQGCPSFR